MLPGSLPGFHHSPDGLSRRKPQPEEESEPEDDFEDWIDQVNGFLHFLNPHPTHSYSITSAPPISCYINESAREVSPDPHTAHENSTPPKPYSIVPRSDSAIAADARLDLVRHFLDTLQRPPELSDKDYKTFMHYAVEFTSSGNLMWRKDPHGFHKTVVPQ